MFIAIQAIQSLIFTAAFYFTFSIIIKCWILHGWLSSGKVDKFEVDFTKENFLVAILWGVFYVLSNL